MEQTLLDGNSTKEKRACLLEGLKLHGILRVQPAVLFANHANPIRFYGYPSNKSKGNWRSDLENISRFDLSRQTTLRRFHNLKLRNRLPRSTFSYQLISYASTESIYTLICRKSFHPLLCFYFGGKLTRRHPLCFIIFSSQHT